MDRYFSLLIGNQLCDREKTIQMENYFSSVTEKQYLFSSGYIQAQKS